MTKTARIPHSSEPPAHAPQPVSMPQFLARRMARLTRGIDNRVHATAPDAFRLAVEDDGEWLDHWDFDLGGPAAG